jgi:hypothetical protein
MLLKLLCALLVIAPVCFAQEPRVSWFDDFLGVKLNPTYALSLSDTAVIKLAPDSVGSGGVAMLSVVGYAPGVARLRLGEDPITGGISALNFSARKNLVYQTRAFLNTDASIAATIGLIGFRDPHNDIALIYGGTPGGNWVFEVTNNQQSFTVDTGFRHAPGHWFTVRIVTEWGEVPKASVWINDTLAGEVTGNYVPTGGLCPEFQLWNMPLTEGHSQPTMWIDYLSISQDR